MGEELLMGFKFKAIIEPLITFVLSPLAPVEQVKLISCIGFPPINLPLEFLFTSKGPVLILV